MTNRTNPEPAENPEFDPEEIEAAVADTTTEVTPAELSEETEDLVAWDEPPGAPGKAAHKVLPEDEVPAGETLTYQGQDEADRERRIAAADPEFEP